MMKYFVLAFLFLACQEMDIDVDAGIDVSIDEDALTQYTTATIVNASLYPSISRSIARYKADIQAEGFSTHVITYQTYSDLVQVIQNEKSQRGIEGVFLIGDLPSYWYEQTAFGVDESFPTDIYLMDLDAEWTDADNDGIFDDHGEIIPDIYVSRLTGSAAQINNYFSKIYAHRRGAPTGDEAIIFKDDDWMSYHATDLYNLDMLFLNTEICTSESCSTRTGYLTDTIQNYAYVFQWVHSSSLRLSFEEGDTIRRADIPMINSAVPRAKFYNLFNCLAARFTQENLGMNYVLNTDAIAVVGSTKTGGMYDADWFHESLTSMTWGQAFKEWYAEVGALNDDWFLGMSIMGDPLLKVPRM
jgi:hypothetical protein